MKARTRSASMAALQLLAAAAATAAARARAKAALEHYRADAQAHFLHYVNAHCAGSDQDASYVTRWQADWESSSSGRQACEALSPDLAGFADAVRTELRMSVANAPDDGFALRGKAEEIVGRDGDGSWEDQALEGIVARVAARLERSV